MIARLILLLILSGGKVYADAPNYQYVVGTGATPCATLQTANAAYASALGTDATTPYWFPIIVLTTGACAIKIIPGDPQIDTSITLPPSAKFPSGKTVSLATAAAAFQVAPATRASLAGSLPDVLTLASFEAVLTSQQIAALNALTSGAIFNYWTAIKGGASIDMSDPTFITVLSSLLSSSKITQGQFTTLTTPASTPCTPQQVPSATCP